MKILFDQGVPEPLRGHLDPHAVLTASELGWSTYRNGELLDAAENDNFDVFISTDQNLKYQQNLAARTVGVLVLLTTSWPKIQKKVSEIRDAIEGLSDGGYAEVDFD
jgi:hypothetical protein